MGQYHQQVVAVIDKLTPYCNTLSNDNSLQFAIAAFIVNRGDYVHNIICDAVTTFDPGTCIILQGASKKTSFSENWPWQILLLTVRNPYWTFANTSKIPSRSLASSKCMGTCDEFIPYCLVVFQAWCCIAITLPLSDM